MNSSTSTQRLENSCRAGKLVLITTLWGFLEATVFFIVPDVYLTRVALSRGIKTALRGCLATLFGAVIGGCLIYAISRSGGYDGLKSFYEQVPGISSLQISTADESLRANGWLALVLGALSGIPYKVYALAAGTQNWPLGTFVLVSIFARLARFSAACLITWLCAKIILNRCEPLTLLRLHIAFWTLFYAAYFLIMQA